MLIEPIHSHRPAWYNLGPKNGIIHAARIHVIFHIAKGPEAQTCRKRSRILVTNMWRPGTLRRPA